MKKLRILLVDDEFLNCLAFDVALHELGNELLGFGVDFEIAGDLETAQKVLDEFKPHIALVDRMFPEVPGRSVSELGFKFGKKLEKRGIPYLIVTYAGHDHLHPNLTDFYYGDEKIVRVEGAKDDPEVWKKALKTLVEEVGEGKLKEIVETKE